MGKLPPIIVFNGRHFVRHLGIFNPICVKLLSVMSGVIPSNLKKTTSLSQTVLLRSTNAAYTHTYTHIHTHTHTYTHTHTHTHTYTHTHTQSAEAIAATYEIEEPNHS